MFEHLERVENMGGDLGGWGDGPSKIWGGDGSCIRPPIFGEVVLWDAREKYEGLKNVTW